jgi:DNA-binding NarL/FixJ family response regulator
MRSVRRNPNWTEREDSIAMLLLSNGMSMAFIGDRLNRSAQAVQARLKWIRMTAERRAHIGRTKTRNRGKIIEEMCDAA